MRSAARGSRAPPAHGGWPRAGRRPARASRSLVDGGRPRARGPRRGGAPGGHRRTGGGSDTTAGGRRAGTRNRLSRSSASRVAPPPLRPVSASQSGPVKRARTDVSSRKARTSGGLAVQDLFREVVDDVAVIAGEPRDEPPTSSRPCIDSAANCRAAIQPSVRASSAATSAADRSRPIDLVQVGGCLVGVKRRSAARTSTSSPRARRRLRRRPGSARVAITMCMRGGQVVQQELHPALDVVPIDEVVVVEDQHESWSAALISLRRVARIASMAGGLWLRAGG